MAARRRVFVDISPLRRSREFRLLYSGQLVSFIGSQLTVVAVPLQVFRITHSSLAVGLVSLAQLGPLLVGSLIGGTVVDATDRRRLLLIMELLLAATSAGLALNATPRHPALWPLYVLTAASAGLSGVDRPARLAIIPTVLDRPELPAAFALWQILLQVGTVAGPALAGLLIGGLGLATVYWIDVATFAVAVVAVSRMRPMPPADGGTKAGLRSILEGLQARVAVLRATSLMHPDRLPSSLKEIDKLFKALKARDAQAAEAAARLHVANAEKAAMRMLDETGSD